MHMGNVFFWVFWGPCCIAVMLKRNLRQEKSQARGVRSHPLSLWNNTRTPQQDHTMQPLCTPFYEVPKTRCAAVWGLVRCFLDKIHPFLWHVILLWSSASDFCVPPKPKFTSCWSCRGRSRVRPWWGSRWWPSGATEPKKELMLSSIFVFNWPERGFVFCC